MTFHIGKLKSLLVSDRSRVVGNVANIMVDNLNFVPNNVKNLLFKLTDSFQYSYSFLKQRYATLIRYPLILELT